MPNPFNKLKPSAIAGVKTLKFGVTNAKLREFNTATFALPAGYTCPGACECLSWFDRDINKLQDGDDAKFRCYAASQEAAFPSVRKSVDHNLALLKEAKTVEAMAELIDQSMPSKYYHRIRIHSDGDFYDQNYFLAWAEVARRNPTRTFYAYTKSLPIWIKFRSLVPENMILTASRGGKWDHLIKPNKLRESVVVFHPEEAAELGLEIDHDDSHARNPEGGDFALLLHGGQQPDSEGSAAIKRMKKEGVKFSYSKNKTKTTANH